MPEIGNYSAYIEIDGFEREAFAISHWSCIEGLAQLSEISVVAHGPADLDTLLLLRKNARLVVESVGSTRDSEPVGRTEIPAMVTSATVNVADAATGRCIVLLTLRSRFYTATLTKSSKVFLEKSVKEIIQEVLEGNGFVEGNDFEFKLKETYETYEYTVQYQETDWDFLSRLMEDVGIYYYMSDRFLNADKSAELKDYLVVLDNKEFHPERSGDFGIDVPFRPANLINPGGEAIGDLRMEHRILPKDVLLKDYNYRKPTVEMKGIAPADPDGVGTYFSYGDHFKTPDDGNALAVIRAEEILCRVRTWHGISGVMDLEPSLIFNLIDHPISDWNGRYIVTSITHTGYQPGAGAVPSDPKSQVGYSNSFTAIKADTQWRPERITPKPKIVGVMHATIDAAASGEYAEIDDMGRYKVKLPFDLSDEKDGKASRYIRMAQPYSGPGMGMHFPLHKGTEVLLIHLDGDPDRPMIVGSIPNPDTASPVTGANQTQCVIHTGGGNKIVIEDTAGGQRIALSSPTANTFFSIGAPPE